MKNIVRAALWGSVALVSPAWAEDISIALHVDPGHEMFQVGKRLKDAIETQSEGRFTVTLLGTEVGGERDHLEGASIGEYQIALGGSMPMSLYARNTPHPICPLSTTTAPRRGWFTRAGWARPSNRPLSTMATCGWSAFRCAIRAT